MINKKSVFLYMDTFLKNTLFWIVSILTGIILLFSTDLINLIINSFIIMIILIIYYDCNFCPKKEDSTKNKDNFNNYLWIYLILISLKFSLILLFYVINEYCDLTKIIVNFEKKFLLF